MAQIIAIANQKGGVAKTTTCIQLAAGLVRRKYKVLLLDLDPQKSLSRALQAKFDFNVEYGDDYINTMIDVLKGDVSINQCIQKGNICDIVPSTSNLANAEIECESDSLKKALDNFENDYDYIIIDTPPSLGILTISSFIACDEVLITTFPEMQAAEGTVDLFDTLFAVKDRINSKLKINGILLCNYESKTTNSANYHTVFSALAKTGRTKLYKTIINKGVAVPEAASLYKDIYSFNSKSKPSKCYEEFIDEFLKTQKL